MYADDMTLIVQGKSRANVVHIANEQLVLVLSWLTNNKAKAKFMIFFLKAAIRQLPVNLISNQK